MSRRRHTPEQIITALREAEVGLANGKKVALVSRELGISEQTYYRWRQEFGGLKIEQSRRLKELGTENGPPNGAVGNREKLHDSKSRGGESSWPQCGQPILLTPRMCFITASFRKPKTATTSSPPLQSYMTPRKTDSASTCAGSSSPPTNRNES